MPQLPGRKVAGQSSPMGSVLDSKDCFLTVAGDGLHRAGLGTEAGVARLAPEGNRACSSDGSSTPAASASSHRHGHAQQSSAVSPEGPGGICGGHVASLRDTGCWEVGLPS